MLRLTAPVEPGMIDTTLDLRACVKGPGAAPADPCVKDEQGREDGGGVELGETEEINRGINSY